MTTTNGPARVSTAGAWVGALVAAWAGATVAWHVALLAASALAPALVANVSDAVEEQAAGASEQTSKLADLAMEGVRRGAAYSRVFDGSAVALGFALFVAAFLLLRGSETGRRATRALLAVKSLHSIVAAAWFVFVVHAGAADWRARFLAAFDEIVRNAPSRAQHFAERASDALHKLPIAVAVTASLGALVSAALWRLAGGPSARNWCAARNRMRPVASPSAPR